jgi:hypothetical protein
MMKIRFLIALFLFVGFINADEIDDNRTYDAGISEANVMIEGDANPDTALNSASLSGKIWECSSDINTLSARITLRSQDIYYTNGMFESKGKISVKAPSLYTQEMSFENPSIGSWSIEEDKFIVSAKGVMNGTQDIMTILTLNDDTFVTKGDNATLRECKVLPQETVITQSEENRFNPEILTANSWKCAINETISGNNTYMVMESVNRYFTNSTSSVEGVMKLKLDEELPEVIYSVIYSETWEFVNGHFRTELQDIKITNLTNATPKNDSAALKEMVSLENIFKKGVVDEMEIVKFNKNGFSLQDLSTLDEESKSRYVCVKN